MLRHHRRLCIFGQSKRMCTSTKFVEVNGLQPATWQMQLEQQRVLSRHFSSLRFGDRDIPHLLYFCNMIYEAVLEADLPRCRDLFGSLNDKETVLTAACRRGHADVVELLVAQGMSVNFTPPAGESPLVSAIRCGSYAIVEFLLKNGARVSHALCLACEIGNIDICELLLTCLNDSPFRGTLMFDALMECCGNDDKIEIVSLLVSRGCDVNAQNANGVTPLILCSQSGALLVARYLLQNGADGAICDNDKCSPLHTCCRLGGVSRAELASELIRRGVPVDCVNASEDAPVHVAVMNNHIELLSVLLDHGRVDVDQRNGHGQSPLIIAATNNNLAWVERLIADRADVDLAGSDGNTALHVACRHNHFDVLTRLLAAQCDIYLNNAFGNTVLHFAAVGGFVQCIESVLTEEVRRGGSGDILLQRTNDFGDTALHFAYCCGHEACVQALLCAGARELDFNKEGANTMLAACRQGDMQVVKRLVLNGSDPSLRNSCGESALDLLTGEDHRDVLRSWNWLRRKPFLLFLYKCSMLRLGGRVYSRCDHLDKNLRKSGDEAVCNSSGDKESGRPIELLDGQQGRGEMERHSPTVLMMKEKRWLTARRRYLHSSVFQNLGICRLVTEFL